MIQLGAGLHLAGVEQGVSEAEWLVAVKIGRRQQQLQSAVSKQQDRRQGEKEGQADRQQRGAPQPPDQQQLPQQQQPVARAALSAELQKAAAEAAAAIAAVGGSSGSSRIWAQAGQQAVQGGGPVRPVIRRQSLSAQAAVQQLSAAGSRGAGLQGRGRRRAATGTSAAATAAAEAGAAAGAEDADDDYRARLPTSKDWKAAAAPAVQPDGGSGRGASPAQHEGASGSGGNASDVAREEEGDDEEEAAQQRSSPIVELSLLLAECVQHGLRTIAFCKSRWVGGWAGGWVGGWACGWLSGRASAMLLQGTSDGSQAIGWRSGGWARLGTWVGWQMGGAAARCLAEASLWQLAIWPSHSQHPLPLRIPCCCYCCYRKLCELVTAYVREILKSTAPSLAGTIAVYRAGYRQAARACLPAHRPLLSRWLCSCCPCLPAAQMAESDLLNHNRQAPTFRPLQASRPLSPRIATAPAYCCCNSLQPTTTHCCCRCCSPTERREIERALFQGDLRAGKKRPQLLRPALP